MNKIKLTDELVRILVATPGETLIVRSTRLDQDLM